MRVIIITMYDNVKLRSIGVTIVAVEKKSSLIQGV
jgi:hypothetical protein